MIAVDLDDVTKTYRGKHGAKRVFENLSVRFPAGSAVGILGTKGSGKSTLIRLIGGSTLPDRGRIRRQGLVSPPIANTRAYHASLSGRENIHFVARVNGLDGPTASAFVENFTGLGATLDQPLSTYTRESRARFLFAASYALPFDVYIADEALFGGSGPFRERCAALVQARRAQASFIFATRSPQMLRRFADIGGVLHDGQLQLFDRVGDAIRTFLALDKATPQSDDTLEEDDEVDEERDLDEPFGPLE
ncbi:ATP-binding cassette domain-containing protein [Ancylobacter sp. 6x-1]|uniref:ATP-binding cassette domain-containing protein n=1 Tax=Ancylobacter crimeensis TaxID=2579147 RepID=A0ABT0DAM9_9HYPH|nr:ATP-binding cassette domain-containing protein [Ancylobacter crimeensis]MCK0196992.1 ATP-binding cassette domain-containing protein [Ancylobacter crimeensis]